VRVPPPPTWRESLSLVVVRWGDYHGPDAFKEAEWGPASATVTDKHVSALCDGALYTRIGPDYEVLSIFVECAADLARVQPALAARLPGLVVFRHLSSACRPGCQGRRLTRFPLPLRRRATSRTCCSSVPSSARYACWPTTQRRESS